MVRSFCMLSILFGFGVTSAQPVARAQVSRSESPDSDEGSQVPEKTERRRVPQTPLRKALAEGLDARLGDRLRELEPIELALRSDAQAVIEALASIPVESIDSQSYDSAAYVLVGVLDEVEDYEVPAYKEIVDHALPLIAKIFDEKVQAAPTEGSSPLLFEILRVLARFGTVEGTNKVIEACKLPLQPESYAWGGVLSIYSEGHPQRDRLYRALSRKIPESRIGVALLDAANQSSLEDEKVFHPFDSPDGKRRLREWLEDPDEEDFIYAHSAAVALAFLSVSSRDELLQLAMNHPEIDVQLEGAWSSGKLGQDPGLRLLAKYCRDVNHSARAREYLKELAREDLVPKEALDKEFLARSEFAQWLAHPNELGVGPDEVIVVDRRELQWPMEKEAKDFFVVRYLMRDRTGLEEDEVDCGVVGSMTWCFFSMNMDQRPPEDVYAIHAAWEMQNADLIKEIESNPEPIESVLKPWTGKPLEEPKLIESLKISRRLKIASRQPSLVEAKIDGEKGWAVIDGERSQWYPASEEPSGSSYAILKIHLGRQLLGFSTPLNRQAFLKVASSIDKTQWLDRFERYLNEVASAEPKRQTELFDGLLSQHFEKYLQFCEETRGTPRNSVLLQVYPRLVQVAKSAPDEVRKELVDSFSVIGENVSSYVEALVASDRQGEVEEFLGFIAPYMDHNLGYATIGNAAYKAKLLPLAESKFLQLKEKLESYYRADEMGLLAQIWSDRGDRDAARALMLDCIRNTAAELTESDNPSDRETLQSELEHHRKTFLDLFPDEETRLNELGVDRATPPDSMPPAK